MTDAGLAVQVSLTCHRCHLRVQNSGGFHLLPLFPLLLLLLMLQVLRHEWVTDGGKLPAVQPYCETCSHSGSGEAKAKEQVLTALKKQASHGSAHLSSLHLLLFPHLLDTVLLILAAHLICSL